MEEHWTTSDKALPPRHIQEDIVQGGQRQREVSPLPMAVDKSMERHMAVRNCACTEVEKGCSSSWANSSRPRNSKAMMPWMIGVNHPAVVTLTKSAMSRWVETGVRRARGVSASRSQAPGTSPAQLYACGWLPVAWSQYRQMP
jgi:hypothetical protein